MSMTTNFRTKVAETFLPAALPLLCESPGILHSKIFTINYRNLPGGLGKIAVFEDCDPVFAPRIKAHLVSLIAQEILADFNDSEVEDLYSQIQKGGISNEEHINKIAHANSTKHQSILRNMQTYFNLQIFPILNEQSKLN